MDDFFLRPEQRTPERLAIPGENIDHERFLSEVLSPLAEGRPFSYRPFDCGTGCLGEPVFVPVSNMIIVEGSYAHHPKLRDAYTLRIFLTVDPEEQMRRIISRNGQRVAAIFRDRWIPMEESYFTALRVPESAHAIYGNP
jgi:uridine kinase